MSNVLTMKAKSLGGWRVLITRARGQAFALADPLRQLGAEVMEVPTIEIHAAGSYAALDHALAKIDHYDTLILTSVNGVEALFGRYHRMGTPVPDMRHLQVVAIGPATARAIQSEGLVVSIVPEKYVAESVVEALRGKLSSNSRVLLVRAKVARDVLPDELRKMSATVDVIEAYETGVPEGAGEKLKEIFADPAKKPRIITFTSSSTVKNFLSLLGANRETLLADVTLASIGPVTSATLRQAGLEPAIEAGQYTMDGLVAAIEQFAAAANTNSLA
jgi:uroporphyrinogen-III synthase